MDGRRDKYYTQYTGLFISTFMLLPSTVTTVDCAATKSAGRPCSNRADYARCRTRVHSRQFHPSHLSEWTTFLPNNTLNGARNSYRRGLSDTHIHAQTAQSYASRCFVFRIHKRIHNGVPRVWQFRPNWLILRQILK